MTVLGRYRLKREMPQLSVGATFEHRTWDPEHPDRGNRATGVMLNSNEGDGWAKGQYSLPGQLADNVEWFEPLELSEKALINRLSEIREMIERIEKDYNLDVS